MVRYKNVILCEKKTTTVPWQLLYYTAKFRKIRRNLQKKTQDDINMIRTEINWDALHDLVPFQQFKKREKHPWRRVTFSNVAGLHHNCFITLNPFLSNVPILYHLKLSENQRFRGVFEGAKYCNLNQEWVFSR